MLDGLITGTPASLRIGIEIALPPELNSPMYAIAAESCAARLRARGGGKREQQQRNEGSERRAHERKDATNGARGNAPERS